MLYLNSTKNIEIVCQTQVAIMKRLYILYYITLLIFIGFSGVVNAQIDTRSLISGEINVPIGDNSEGITIYNRTTNKGTITNENGEFQISAGINDRIDVIAMQYQKFTVIVDKGIVARKTLKIVLHEAVNQLDEVVVSPYDLAGNVDVDVKRIPVNEGNIAEVANETSGRINDSDYNFTPDQLTTPENDVMLQNRMKNGLNFVNLFKLVVGDQNEDEQKSTFATENRLRNLYNDEFFKQEFDLELNEINDFIAFAKENGLDDSYLKEGKELDLIEFLRTQRLQYNVQKQ
ncbi:carboxypeptidase-like protein [Aquimarina intermedia]|uniref:Carboxypeptidase-like protein n=2 Tax=Aquimarina intermedia TaxID=350814 RepID=A0A5S5BV26_9FLAO|nr:carboxypeptidase-like protein [Aquimarina intermedia]